MKTEWRVETRSSCERRKEWKGREARWTTDRSSEKRNSNLNKGWERERERSPQSYQKKSVWPGLSKNKNSITWVCPQSIISCNGFTDFHHPHPQPTTPTDVLFLPLASEGWCSYWEWVGLERSTLPFCWLLSVAMTTPTGRFYVLFTSCTLRGSARRDPLRWRTTIICGPANSNIAFIIIIFKEHHSMVPGYVFLPHDGNGTVSSVIGESSLPFFISLSLEQTCRVCYCVGMFITLFAVYIFFLFYEVFL